MSQLLVFIATHSSENSRQFFLIFNDIIVRVVVVMACMLVEARWLFVALTTGRHISIRLRVMAVHSQFVQVCLVGLVRPVDDLEGKKGCICWSPVTTPLFIISLFIFLHASPRTFLLCTSSVLSINHLLSHPTGYGPTSPLVNQRLEEFLRQACPSRIQLSMTSLRQTTGRNGSKTLSISLT